MLSIASAIDALCVLQIIQAQGALIHGAFFSVSLGISKLMFDVAPEAQRALLGKLIETAHLRSDHRDWNVFAQIELGIQSLAPEMRPLAVNVWIDSSKHFSIHEYACVVNALIAIQESAHADQRHVIDQIFNRLYSLKAIDRPAAFESITQCVLLSKPEMREMLLGNLINHLHWLPNSDQLNAFKKINDRFELVPEQTRAKWLAKLISILPQRHMSIWLEAAEHLRSKAQRLPNDEKLALLKQLDAQLSASPDASNTPVAKRVHNDLRKAKASHIKQQVTHSLFSLFSKRAQ